MHKRNGDRAVSYGGGDPLDCAPADVTGGEHPGQARLMWQWLAAGVPAGPRVVQHVLTGEDETPPVPREVLAEPFAPWLGTDENDRWPLLVGSTGGGPTLARRCRPPSRLRHRRPVFRHRASPLVLPAVHHRAGYDLLVLN